MFVVTGVLLCGRPRSGYPQGLARPTVPQAAYCNESEQAKLGLDMLRLEGHNNDGDGDNGHSSSSRSSSSSSSSISISISNEEYPRQSRLHSSQ